MTHFSIAIVLTLTAATPLGAQQSRRTPERLLCAADAKLLVSSKTQEEMSEYPASVRREVTREILAHARLHGLDPVLLTAVIQQESGFSTTRIGSHGEIGLMQIKPVTARWVADRNGLPWTGAESLKDPSVNIALGTQYLAMLRDDFDSGHLSLTAYNMGPVGVKRSLRRNYVPREYATSVMRRYRELQARRNCAWNA